MKSLFLVPMLLCVIATPGFAQTKADSCAAYARDAAEATPTTTGAMRGAARGAVGGAIFGNAGAGAATGAVVGSIRRGNQKRHSYRYYYDGCMAR